MRFATPCPACAGTHPPHYGIECVCGRHFHIGSERIVGNDLIECPSCGASIDHPVKLGCERSCTAHRGHDARGRALPHAVGSSEGSD